MSGCVGKPVADLALDIKSLGLKIDSHLQDVSSSHSILEFTSLIGIVSEIADVKEGKEAFHTAQKTHDVSGRVFSILKMFKGGAGVLKTGVDVTANALTLVCEETGVLASVSTGLNGVVELINVATYGDSARKSMEIGGSRITVVKDASKAIKAAVTATSKVLSLSVDTSAKVASVACKVLEKAGSSLSVVEKTCKGAANLVTIREGELVERGLFSGVRGLVKLYTEHPEELERVAPETYLAIREGSFVTNEMVQDALLEVQTLVKEKKVAFILAVLGIISAIASMVYTEGALMVIAVVTSLLVSFGDLGVDRKSLLKKLEKCRCLSGEDLVMNVITIVITLMIITGSIAVAPTALAALSVSMIGVAMLSSPVATIIYLKMKEQREEEVVVETRSRVRDFFEKHMQRVQFKYYAMMP